MSNRPTIRQIVVGLVALPLSALPFVGYLTLTPEGRLVRDKVMVSISPPRLPELSDAAEARIESIAPRYNGGVMVLAYHGIGSSDAEGGFVISPERFGKHLAVLRAAGMHFVTAAQVADAFKARRSLPRNAVMVTFDDGRADAMMFADPLLEQADATATMFVIADAAGDPGVYYAGWEDIKAYAASGRWDIQSHTSDLHREREVDSGGTLPALTSLAPHESIAEFRARVHADLQSASSAIEARTGTPPVAFAYPFGAYGADRNNHPRIEAVVRHEVARHYDLGFQQDDQDTIPLANCASDALLLRRLEVGDWSGVQLLARIRSAARRTKTPDCALRPRRG
jgi:peptidoglycan/xylan/chitin deacetylase (PgdA/CDA1 family)